MSIDSTTHFRILEDIARDLSEEVNFPTCLDAAIMVRNTLKDPDVSLDKVAKILSIEPLITSKLLRVANSVAYNPAGRAISDLKTAIARLGFEVVRSTSLAVAMDQMLKSRNLSGFDTISRATWEHSLQTAAIGRVLARRVGGINADEAMLCGMVQNIGVFYLLYRAAEYPEYRSNPEAVHALVAGWNQSIGESLLHVLGLPDTVIEAVREHEKVANVAAPNSLKDILYFANILAGDHPLWALRERPAFATPEALAADRERYTDLLEEAQDDIAELRAALAG